MSKKSPVVLATETATDLNTKEINNTGDKAKAFYQYFTIYFIGIFLFFSIASSMSLMFSYQQSRESQALINDQLVPLQMQFQQQIYLIKANKLVADILKNPDIRYLIPLQQKLTLQSKKLSLLESSNNSNYQQWFLNNTSATELVTKIESNNGSNELLKSRGLLQIDTLLDAIEIMLSKSEVNEKAKQALTTVKNKLLIIVTDLQRLSLQTSLEEFNQLQAQIDEMFVADYGKVLASHRHDSQGMTEIVRDFIRFEDMVLKHSLLIKWQGNLRLMEDYQHQLISEQQQIKSILEGLTESSLSNDALIDIRKANTQSQLPIWLWTAFALILLSFAILLWYIRFRIKTFSEHTLGNISDVLVGGTTKLDNKDNDRQNKHNEAEVNCAEYYLLVDKIQQLNDSRVSEIEYLALVEKNKTLEAKVSKAHAKQEQKQQQAQQQAGNNPSEKSKSMREQLCFESFHKAAINQLVLLGNSAIDTSVNTQGNNKYSTDKNYLYHAYLQGCELVRHLKQQTHISYLQSSDAVMTLNDEILVAQLQSILLNLADEFSACHNQVSLEVDDKIQTSVNLDAELFSEMFKSFIKLLLSQQTQQKLLIRLQLVDKNNGQQRICFSGQVQGDETFEQLPQRFESFNEVNSEKNQETEYLITLLQYQHGENINATVMESGYQLSFTIPLAVTDSKQELSHQSMNLPAHLPTIDQALIKLTAKYLTMPIGVLLAVKYPEQYQRLQKLLQGMGLQVSFVSSERMLKNKWQSGRFAVLITELSYNPFTHFMLNEQDIAEVCADLPRGVFTLDEGTLSLEPEEDFTHWTLGKLTANSSIDELITAMLPWLKEQPTKAIVTENNIEQANRRALTPTKQPPSFNFSLYIKHQGSAELALYMLDEYTTENMVLVTQLEQAFSSNDVVSANVAIQALVVNSKILAADHLLHLCVHWQNLLSKQGIDNSQKIQISLLNKTKQAVKAINLHADAVA